MNPLRSLLRTPAYSVTVLAVLALGIGTVTAIFSVVHAVLLEPLRYREADRLYQIEAVHPREGGSVLTPAAFAALARETSAFETVAAQHYDYVNLTRTLEPTRITGVQATADYFRLFGVPALRGRTWNEAETRAGSPPVAVLSEGLWRRHFGGRETLLGETIHLDDVAHTVIGIMPASFSDPWGNAQLWRPIAVDGPVMAERTNRYFGTFGRIRDGVTRGAAGAELERFAARLAAEEPAVHREWTLNAASLRLRVVGTYRAGLLVVLGAVGCLLLVTCLNVAGLAVVRAMARSRELAVRSALGASRARLLRECLAESLVLALGGGALGVLLAHWGVTGLMVFVGDGWLPRMGEIAINAPVLGVTLAVALGTGVGFGLAPAWYASRANPAEALREGSGRASRGPGVRRLRLGLVVAEMAFAVALLSAVALLGRAFIGIRDRDPGMRVDELLAVGLSLSSTRYDSAEKRRAFYLSVEEEVGRVPGVIASAFTQTLPFTWGIPLTLYPADKTPEAGVSVYYDSVGADFFRAGGIPLVAGRLFGAADAEGQRQTVILSASAARAFFGTENAVGRELAAGPAAGQRLEVIGVVGDVMREGLAAKAPPMQAYRPLRQRPPAFATLLVRTSVPPGSLAPAIRQAVWRIDADQAIGTVNTVDRLIDSGLTQPRLYLVLFALFGAMALSLASLGLYGLVAYSVAQRTREFGIRAALGATRQDVRRLVLREGAGVTGIGIVLGLALAFAGERFLQHLLEQVEPTPLLYATVGLVLAAVGLAAAWIPAARASRVDPMEALRSE